MDLDTWVSLGTIIATGAAITTLMLRAIGRLDNKIEAVDKNWTPRARRATPMSPESQESRH